MDGSLGQKLTIEKRTHPPGEKGVRSSLEEVAKKVAAGATHAKVIAWAREQLVRANRVEGIACRTDRERAEVLLRACQKKLWIPDPVGTEFMAGAHLLACDASTHDEICYLGADCFPSGTLVLKKGHELTKIEDVRVGDRIWGLDRWSSVTAFAYKGILSVDVIRMNNGSELKLTSDHHVYVLDCREHSMLEDEIEEAKALPKDRHWRGSEGSRPGCYCREDARIEKRIRVSELRPGMVMPHPKRIPFGTEAMDPDRAWIEGVYVADGWCSKNSAFEISGQDGCPKEAQKLRVQSICDRLEIPTRWYRKYISVKDGDWALRVQQMGTHAPEKRLLSINFDEASAAETLRGVMADSGKNTGSESRTFTTTSHLLAVQVRLLHRMFGITCGYRFVANHGGLGQNPVHRLGTRGREREDGRAPWLLRVRDIERDVVEAPCWDIETDDHRVYLAEHDVTVSQCDELASLFGASLLAVGIDALVVGHGYGPDRQIVHVLCAARVRDEGGASAISGGRYKSTWLYGDPSLPKLKLGEVTPFTRERVLSVPDVRVLCDSSNCLGTRDFDPDELNFVSRGVFVGVDGPPERSIVSWRGTPRWLGSPGTLGSFIDDAYNRCIGQGADEKAASYAGCAADVYCATYGVPPGVCGTVTAGLVSAVADLFGGDDYKYNDPHLTDAGQIIELMNLHDRLFPSEPSWRRMVIDVRHPPPDVIDLGRDYEALGIVAVKTILSEQQALEAGYARFARRAMVDLVRAHGWDLHQVAHVDTWPAFLRAVQASKLDLMQRSAQTKAGGTPKRSAAVPVVLGLGAAGALAWWFLR